MTFVVLYDACVLYPNTLRDLLIRVGRKGFVRARWTEMTVDEVDRRGTRNHQVPPEKLAHRGIPHDRAVRDCLVTGSSRSSRGAS